jgi:Ca2+-binding RTX toxin-like protein
MYQVFASDADGNPLIISATTLPAWLTLVDHGNGTATLSGTPTNAFAGTNNVVLSVSDGSASVGQSFGIQVTANKAPTFTSTPITTATSGVSYTYVINTADFENNARSITATTLPAWLTLVDNHDGTATLTGMPADANVGLNSVVLRVSDAFGGGTDQAFAITVAPAPVASPISLDASGLLTVNGTIGDDSISISLVGSKVRATMNRFDATFALAAVRSVRILGLAGNDTIKVDTGSIGAWADGGDGDDVLNGGFENDTFFGGNGADKITAGAGNDLLDGGAGNDILKGEDGDDTLLGGAGDDDLWAGKGNDVVDPGTGKDVIHKDK